VRNNQRRERTAGELAAYQMGLELGAGQSRSTHRRRREVHISPDGLVLVEEETYIEERY
jgi:hypothetical protein